MRTVLIKLSFIILKHYLLKCCSKKLKNANYNQYIGKLICSLKEIKKVLK